MITWYIEADLVYHKTSMKVLDEDLHKQKHLFDGDVDYGKDFGEMTLNIPAILSSFAVQDFTAKPKSTQMFY